MVPRGLPSGQIPGKVKIAKRKQVAQRGEYEYEAPSIETTSTKMRNPPALSGSPKLPSSPVKKHKPPNTGNMPPPPPPSIPRSPPSSPKAQNPPKTQNKPNPPKIGNMPPPPPPSMPKSPPSSPKAKNPPKTGNKPNSPKIGNMPPPPPPSMPKSPHSSATAPNPPMKGVTPPPPPPQGPSSSAPKPPMAHTPPAAPRPPMAHSTAAAPKSPVTPQVIPSSGGGGFLDDIKKGNLMANLNKVNHSSPSEPKSATSSMAGNSISQPSSGNFLDSIPGGRAGLKKVGANSNSPMQSSQNPPQTQQKSLQELMQEQRLKMMKKDR